MLAGVQAPKVEIGPANSFPGKWEPILVSTRGAFWMVEDQLRLRDRGEISRVPGGKQSSEGTSQFSPENYPTGISGPFEKIMPFSR